MAIAYPDGIVEDADSPHTLELETLEILRVALPHDVRVYHAVHWSKASRKGTFAGEIDFVVLGSRCRLVLVEQKNGPLVESDDGLHKQYPEQRKSIRAQMARSADHLRGKLGRRFGKGRVAVDSLLYCPDHSVRALETAGIDPDRIIDAARRDQLPAKLLEILATDVPGPESPADDGLHAQLHQFLLDELEIVPDVGATVGRRHAAHTRLSGGLAQWARQLRFKPFRLRVLGTAGSGKTQLALAVYRDAIAAGRRPLYVCFNRPLADHFSTLVPAGGKVANYHQLGDQLLRASGVVPDFSRRDVYDQFEAALAAASPAPTARFDVLIVDEGQDFKPAWDEHLLRWLHPNGDAWWLEDPMQNLYRRPPAALDGWVTLHADTNFRSPGLVVSALNRLLPLATPLTCGSQYRGELPHFITYHSDSDLVQATETALRDCLQSGFPPGDIALLTYRGRDSSLMSSYTEMAGHTLRVPTGRFTEDGTPLYRDGDVVFDTVHRFKGRSAPCVIVTEIDFGSLDDDAARRLFVGATRASMHLVMLLSARADAALRAHLQAEANL
jgi:hypothetical protein